MQEVIPTGSQTLSKLPSRFINGVYPKLLRGGDGCYVESYDHKLYVDFICGLGPIILGYNHPTVNSTVIEKIRAGQVLLSLPSELELGAARRLAIDYEAAEMSRFFKTGSDALSAAVKVARAYTGKMTVAVCGYHGWHDWYTIANDKKGGIPLVLNDYVKKFVYNDLQSLEDILKTGDVAAVVLEPVVYEAPRDGFLQKVVDLAHQHHALVVFDEVVTGYRFGLAGAAGYFGVKPDLACFSKAMANGFPMAALSGLKEYMRVFERDDVFISGTFGGDLIGIAANDAVRKVLVEKDGLMAKKIWRIGEAFKNCFLEIVEQLQLSGDVNIVGYPPRTMFVFPTTAHKALFWQECIKGNILFGYANFINTCHSDGVLQHTANVMEMAMRQVKQNWADPKAKLEGEMPVEVFNRVGEVKRG